MNRLDELAQRAHPLFEFLSRDLFFGKSYHGNRRNRQVLSSVEDAWEYATDDSSECFDEWLTVSEAEDVFPKNFEWKPWIDRELGKNNYFDITKKNFNGADAKWTR